MRWKQDCPNFLKISTTPKSNKHRLSLQWLNPDFSRRDNLSRRLRPQFHKLFAVLMGRDLFGLQIEIFCCHYGAGKKNVRPQRYSRRLRHRQQLICRRKTGPMFL